MRVVIHSAAMQDRDGAALVLNKIHNRFPWLQLVWPTLATMPIRSILPSPKSPCCGSISSSGATT